MEGKSNGAVTYTVLSPLDWGIAFALVHKWRLFAIALLPIIVELYVTHYIHNHRLFREHYFIVFAVTAIVDVWMLMVSTMFCLDVIRGKEIRLSALGTQALRHLPKVLFSYLATLFIVLFGLRVLVVPGLIFMGFFIWAPAFCIGEFCLGSSSGNGKERARDLPDYEAEELLEKKAASSFHYKSLWELGLFRSAKLAGRSFSTSFQLALLVLAANIIPLALVDLFGESGLSYFNQAWKVILATLFNVIVIGAWAGAFIMLLPMEGKTELGVASYLDPNKFFPEVKGKYIRFDGKVLPHLVLISATIISGWYVWVQSNVRSVMPETVSTEVLSAERRNGEFVVSLRLVDSVDKFRWLVPDNFRVAFPKPEVAEENVDQEAAKQPAEKNFEQILEKLLVNNASGGGGVLENMLLSSSPGRVVILDENGAIVPAGSFIPYFGPLEFVFHFKLPADIPDIGNFSLYYPPLSSMGDPIYQGTYSTE